MCGLGRYLIAADCFWNVDDIINSDLLLRGLKWILGGLSVKKEVF